MLSVRVACSDQTAKHKEPSHSILLRDLIELVLQTRGPDTGSCFKFRSNRERGEAFSRKRENGISHLRYLSREKYMSPPTLLPDERYPAGELCLAALTMGRRAKPIPAISISAAALEQTRTAGKRFLESPYQFFSPPHVSVCGAGCDFGDQREIIGGMKDHKKAVTG